MRFGIARVYRVTDLAVPFQTDAAHDLAATASGDEKTREIFFHPIGREAYFREEIKHLPQTLRGGLLDDDNLMSHLNVRC